MVNGHFGKRFSFLDSPDMSPLDYYVNSAIKKFIRSKNCSNRNQAENFITEWLTDDANQEVIRRAILGSTPDGGFKSRWRCLWQAGGDAIQSVSSRKRLASEFLNSS